MNPITSSHRLRSTALVAGTVLLLTVVAACSSSSDSSSPTTTTAASTTAAETTTTAATTTMAGSSTTGSSTTVPGATTTAPMQPMAGFSTGTLAGTGRGTGAAVLTAVRVGRNPGFDRIVFQFQGTTVPGYKVAWVNPPIIADPSGKTVRVAGSAYLSIRLEPASGYDQDAAKQVYTGPTRIVIASNTPVLRDLVQTGDFEAVLNWVAGTTGRVPVRVLRLSSPARLAIDLQTS